MVNTYSEAIEELGKQNQDLRLRDEHSQIVTPQDQLTFQKYNIIASVQPTHATSDYHFAPDRLGNRTSYAYPWKSFLNLGVHLAAGSDFPVERVDPLLGFYAALTRKDLSGEPPGGWMPEQCLDRWENLFAWTTWNAYAAFQEDVNGKIQPGYFADFVVLTKDVMQIPPEEILNTKVISTYVGGKLVYSV